MLLDYKILVKFPTRERPLKFLEVVSNYIRLADDKTIQYLISIDDNDVSMQMPYIKGRMLQLGLTVYSGQSANKIHAVNRDMHKAIEWDICVLASDDMVCVQQGWDTIIKTEMAMHFKDTDGVIYHWDGDNATKNHDNGKGLNTMCIVGKKYYNRFGYLYHPEYKSLWCDNEFTDVSRILNKEFKNDKILFKHEHFSNNSNIKPDNLMKKTQSFFKEDEQIFLKRKSINFGL